MTHEQQREMVLSELFTLAAGEAFEALLADAEDRGRAEYRAEVTRLEARLVEARHLLWMVRTYDQRELDESKWGVQADEWIDGKGAPTPASAELERDVATVRFFVDLTVAGGTHPSGAPQALDRIAAALGVKT